MPLRLLIINLVALAVKMHAECFQKHLTIRHLRHRTKGGLHTNYFKNHQHSENLYWKIGEKQNEQFRWRLIGWVLLYEKTQGDFLKACKHRAKDMQGQNGSCIHIKNKIHTKNLYCGIFVNCVKIYCDWCNTKLTSQ